MGHWHFGNYMDNLKPTQLSKLKIQASFLLKDLKGNPAKSRNSAKRFLKIPFFSNKTDDWVINHSDLVQLKHAYHLLAIENGFKTWADLKFNVIKNDCLYKSSGVAYIYAWFKDYQNAELYHQKHGGYLITIWKDFVVCGKEYIRCIGLNQYEESWKRIGYNWARPKNKEAWHFLKEQARKNYIKQN